MIKKIFLLMGLVFLFPIFSLAAETGQKSGWKGRKEKVDGIDIIRNPKTPLYGPDVFRLEEEWTVGPHKGEKMSTSRRPGLWRSTTRKEFT